MSQDSLPLEMSIRPYQKAQYSLWAITAKEAILATLETAWGRSPFMTSLGQLVYEYSHSIKFARSNKNYFSSNSLIRSNSRLSFKLDANLTSSTAVRTNFYPCSKSLRKAFNSIRVRHICWAAFVLDWTSLRLLP